MNCFTLKYWIRVFGLRRAAQENPLPPAHQSLDADAGAVAPAQCGPSNPSLRTKPNSRVPLGCPEIWWTQKSLPSWPLPNCGGCIFFFQFRVWRRTSNFPLILRPFLYRSLVRIHSGWGVHEQALAWAPPRARGSALRGRPLLRPRQSLLRALGGPHHAGGAAPGGGRPGGQPLPPRGIPQAGAGPPPRGSD